MLPSPPKSAGKNASVQDSVKAHRKFQTRRRPSKSTPILQFGTILRGKYRLDKIIGAGGYGQILKATDIKTGGIYAVKCMPADQCDAQRMIQEQQILRKLKGKPSFPVIENSGTTEGLMFIVMQLLGKSISELRKQSERKRFDPATAIRVGIQGLESLKQLHEIGFVHRDVKPGNMCIGLSPETRRIIYTLDFGLARCFKARGKLLKRRDRVGFRGTQRYVSLNVHEHREQCASDDLISLFYSIVECSEGNLPWTKLRDPKQVAIKKKNTDMQELTKLQPEALWEFYVSCYDCEDPNFPEYDQLHKILKDCLPAKFDLRDTPMSYEAFLMENSTSRTTSRDVSLYASTEFPE